jgi:hypothetical protein
MNKYFSPYLFIGTLIGSYVVFNDITKSFEYNKQRINTFKQFQKLSYKDMNTKGCRVLTCKCIKSSDKSGRFAHWSISPWYKPGFDINLINGEYRIEDDYYYDDTFEYYNCCPELYESEKKREAIVNGVQFGLFVGIIWPFFLSINLTNILTSK